MSEQIRCDICEKDVKRSEAWMPTSLDCLTFVICEKCIKKAKETK